MVIFIYLDVLYFVLMQILLAITETVISPVGVEKSGKLNRMVPLFSGMCREGLSE